MEENAFLQWRKKKEIIFLFFLAMAVLLVICPVASSLNDEGFFLQLYFPFSQLFLSCPIVMRVLGSYFSVLEPIRECRESLLVVRYYIVSYIV